MHTIMNDVVALDAQAVRASVELVERARPADMARPTPCADWTLHGLITPLTAQHYGFAAAAGGDGDQARWRPRRLGSDPAADYRASAEAVLAAFSADGVLGVRPRYGGNRQRATYGIDRLSKVTSAVLRGVEVPTRDRCRAIPPARIRPRRPGCGIRCRCTPCPSTNASTSQPRSGPPARP
jgi:hypothetical protein